LSKLNEFVAEVTGRLKSYRIQEDSLWYGFVDRELEVTRILDPRVGGRCWRSHNSLLRP
jgi:hypothetical protein